MTTKKTLATLLGLLLAGSLSMATAACGDTGTANTDSGAGRRIADRGCRRHRGYRCRLRGVPIGTDVELEGEIQRRRGLFPAD